MFDFVLKNELTLLAKWIMAITAAFPFFYLIHINFFVQKRAVPTPSANETLNRNSGSYVDAIRIAAEAAEKNPTYQTYLNLGLVYYQSGDYSKSIEATQKAIDLNPKQAVAYNNLAAAYGALGKWELEIAACEKALQLDPNFTLARNNLEWAKMQLDKSKMSNK